MHQPGPLKGRGAAGNSDGRFESVTHASCDDGWKPQEATRLHTTLTPDKARRIVSHNDSPDVGFRLSINPYRGCEHGCVYCFARPTHAYLGLSAGLDFESRLFYKPDAVRLLVQELRSSRYRCSPIALGINTDAYQPVERGLALTRSILTVLRDFNHPVTIVTKSALVERDIDILAPMARRNLVAVYFSITTLEASLSRRLEPRATAPHRRLAAISKLHEAGIPTGVMVAPVIPVLTDAQLERILAQAQQAGARFAGYVILRLPHEVKDLFKEWLAHHAPHQAKHVMRLMQSLHGGKDYDATFGQRMRGVGPFADLIAQRFRLACKRLGLNREALTLDCSHFEAPAPVAAADDPGVQLSLF